MIDLRMIVMAAVLAAAPAIAASPFDGTWKGDTAASQVSKKPNIYKVSGGRFSCSTCVPAFDVIADGTPQPVAGSPYADTVAVTVDGNTVRRVGAKGGKMTWETTSVVAADGKTMVSSFTDMTAANGVPITGSTKMMRVGAAPAGAHPLSGSWVSVDGGSYSDSALVFTLALDGDTLKMTTPTGTSYAARLGAPPSPVVGDPGWTAVAVKRTGPSTLVETDYRDGKPIGTYRMTISADGNTMTTQAHDLLTDRKSTLVGRKQ